MQTIHKQILTDENGHPIGVLIPYKEWLSIERQLPKTFDSDDSTRLQQYAGKVQLKEDPVSYQQHCRNEWM